MEVLSIFSAFGLSASTGLNAYIPLIIVALLAKFTNLITLQSPWDALTSWWIIGILFILALIEFFADSTPAINHVNDLIQTFVRPAAGAIAFAASAQVITDVHPILAMGLGVLISGGVHATKALAVRPAVTATTGGAANLPVSMLEDFTATVVSIISIVIPIIIACIFIIITTWLILRMLNNYQKQYRMQE